MTDFALQSMAAVDMDGPTMPAHGASGGGGGDAGAFFENLLDIINPLQHLPIISTIYRAATGDTIAGPARLIGGALYGGPLGAAGAAVNLAVEDLTGSDVGEHMLALMSGEEAAPTDQIASRDGTVGISSKRDPVLVSIGDVYGMMPDAVTWNGEWRTHAAPPAQQARVERRPGPPVTVAEREAEPEVPRAVPTQTAWVAAAIAEAEQNRDSIEAGRGSIPAAKPAWIATAMEQALDKYQMMAVGRSNRSAAPTRSPQDVR